MSDQNQAQHDGAMTYDDIVRETFNRAIEVVVILRGEFLSEEYAFPQPSGSTQERFACTAVIAALEALRDEVS